MTFDVDESQRQMILLAIARLAVERPGWDWTLGELAQQLKGRALFEDFKQLKREEVGEPAPAQEPSSA
jgi:hypothetical protein